jgi:hypothetical protein
MDNQVNKSELTYPKENISREEEVAKALINYNPIT